MYILRFEPQIIRLEPLETIISTSKFKGSTFQVNVGYHYQRKCLSQQFMTMSPRATVQNIMFHNYWMFSTVYNRIQDLNKFGVGGGGGGGVFFTSTVPV